MYDINNFQFQRFIGEHNSKIVFWGYVMMKIIYYMYVIVEMIVLLLFNFSMEHLFINGDEKALNKATRFYFLSRRYIGSVRLSYTSIYINWTMSFYV